VKYLALRLDEAADDKWEIQLNINVSPTNVAAMKKN
jgi:hypothetical protein